MNKAKLLVALILIAAGVTPGQATAEVYEGTLRLTGSESMELRDAHLQVSGGLALSGNSTLLLINTRLEFLDSPGEYYTMAGTSRLRLENSSITWNGGGTLLTFEYAGIEANDSTLGQLTGGAVSGVGLSDYSSLEAAGSTMGVIRATDRAECHIRDSTIAEFGSMSANTSKINSTTLNGLTLTYHNKEINLTGDLTGHHTSLTPGRFIAPETTLFPLRLTNVTIVNPPGVWASNSTLTLNHTALTQVTLLWGSETDATGSTIGDILLSDTSRLTLKDTRVETLNAIEGDFNIQTENSSIGYLGTNLAIGINLVTVDTQIGTLDVQVFPHAPANIETINTVIENLKIGPSPPQLINVHDTTLTGSLLLVAQREPLNTPMLTGSIRFTTGDVNYTHPTTDQIKVTRVYLVNVTSEGKPVQDSQVTVQTGETIIKTAETGTDGTAVFTLTYTQSPGEADGNLTQKYTLKAGDETRQISLTSDTPINIQAPSTPRTFTAALLALAAAAATILAYRATRGKPEPTKTVYVTKSTDKRILTENS